jgi:hypothetical protein
MCKLYNKHYTFVRLVSVLSSQFNCHKLHFKYSLSVIDQASNKINPHINGATQISFAFDIPISHYISNYRSTKSSRSTAAGKK